MPAKVNLGYEMLHDAVLDEALAIGERLAGLPPQALRATKAAMNMHLSRAALGVLEYALAERVDHDPRAVAERAAGPPRMGRLGHPGAGAG